MSNKIQKPQNYNIQHPTITAAHKLKEVSPPFPSIYSCIVFYAASRSGKTSLMLSISNHHKLYKKACHMIFCIIPVNSLTPISEQLNVLLDLPNDQLYSNLDYDTLSEIYHKILHLAIIWRIQFFYYWWYDECSNTGMQCNKSFK